MEFWFVYGEKLDDTGTDDAHCRDCSVRKDIVIRNK